jgi:hypothetical protein
MTNSVAKVLYIEFGKVHHKTGYSVKNWNIRVPVRQGQRFLSVISKPDTESTQPTVQFFPRKLPKEKSDGSLNHVDKAEGSETEDLECFI